MSEVDLGKIGYFIVGSFVAAWIFSVVLRRVRRYEERLPDGIAETQHTHTELHINDEPKSAQAARVQPPSGADTLLAARPPPREAPSAGGPG